MITDNIFDKKYLENIFYQLCELEPESGSEEEVELIKVFCLLTDIKNS